MGRNIFELLGYVGVRFCLFCGAFKDVTVAVEVVGVLWRLLGFIYFGFLWELGGELEAVVTAGGIEYRVSTFLAVSCVGHERLPVAHFVCSAKQVACRAVWLEGGTSVALLSWQNGRVGAELVTCVVVWGLVGVQAVWVYVELEG